MSNNIRIIYLYAVSFITLVILASAVVSTINSITRFMYPTSYLYDYNYYSSSDIYSQETDKNIVNKEDDAERLRSLKSVFSSIALIIVSAPLYVYHWKKIETERKVVV